MKRTLLKFVVAIAICFTVHILVDLFSSIFVHKLTLNTRRANFTIYDGYADYSILLAYVLISTLLVFNKIKGSFVLIVLGWFTCYVLFKAFVTDIIVHYLRFYVKTQQNGVYSSQFLRIN